MGAVELQCFLMDPCVYTTQHGPWLRAAVGCSPKKPPVWFRSGKRWKKAHKLLTSHPTLPVLFREQDGTTPVLGCRFVADLVEIHFVADHLATDRARRAWLKDRLWLQRDTMSKNPSPIQNWDIDKETDTFLKAVTWFSVQNVREIKPLLPLPRLRLLEDNRPLSSEYRRGYALCRFPKNEIKPVIKTDSRQERVSPRCFRNQVLVKRAYALGAWPWAAATPNNLRCGLPHRSVKKLWIGIGAG